MPELLHSKIIGKGKPLLILHGLLGMGDNWITMARRYAEGGFEVHLIDQRNHGKSFHSDEMNYEVMLDDLHNYIAYYQLDSFGLLGHSMGGKTAMYYATNYPQAVDKLIVVDIAPKYYPPHHRFIFKALNKIKPEEFTGRKAIEAVLQTDIETPAIRQFLMKNLARQKNHSFYWKANLPVLEASLEELGKALPVSTVYEKETCFIKGKKSPYIQPEDRFLIRTHFPQAEIIEIPKAGHWVHAEQPELFFTKTFSFLKK